MLKFMHIIDVFYLNGELCQCHYQGAVKQKLMKFQMRSAMSGMSWSRRAASHEMALSAAHGGSAEKCQTSTHFCALLQSSYLAFFLINICTTPVHSTYSIFVHSNIVTVKGDCK